MKQQTRIKHSNKKVKKIRNFQTSFLQHKKSQTNKNHKISPTSEKKR